jgi:hypothetical protein
LHLETEEETAAACNGDAPDAPERTEMSQTRIKIKKNKRESSKAGRSAKYWMAVGTMAA